LVYWPQRIAAEPRFFSARKKRGICWLRSRAALAALAAILGQVLVKGDGNTLSFKDWEGSRRNDIEKETDRFTGQLAPRG
jgi:hypothetical protein